MKYWVRLNAVSTRIMRRSTMRFRSPGPRLRDVAGRESEAAFLYRCLRAEYGGEREATRIVSSLVMLRSLAEA
jgi:hypothetical protein